MAVALPRHKQIKLAKKLDRFCFLVFQGLQNCEGKHGIAHKRWPLLKACPGKITSLLLQKNYCTAKPRPHQHRDMQSRAIPQASE
jgi:hypothetical protein